MQIFKSSFKVGFIFVTLKVEEQEQQRSEARMNEIFTLRRAYIHMYVCVYVCMKRPARSTAIQKEEEEDEKKKQSRDSIKIKVWICLAYFSKKRNEWKEQQQQQQQTLYFALGQLLAAHWISLGIYFESSSARLLTEHVLSPNKWDWQMICDAIWVKWVLGTSMYIEVNCLFC